MDDVVARILTSYDTITVVGASAHPVKPAHGVPAIMQRHGWRIIPVNLRGGQILGEQAYRKLAEVPEQVGLVDVFRPAEQTPDIARQAVAAGATALWLQLGAASASTRPLRARERLGRRRGAGAVGALAAVLGGVLLRGPELVDELLHPGIGRRAEPQLEAPGGHHHRGRQPGVGGQGHVPGTRCWGSARSAGRRTT